MNGTKKTHTKNKDKTDQKAKLCETSALGLEAHITQHFKTRKNKAR